MITSHNYFMKKTKTYNELKLFSGLVLIRRQWKLLFLAGFAALVILSLDFFLTISMPRVIEELSIVINSENIFNVPNYLIALILLIVIRPIIGWCISFFQISMILKILRNLEDEITVKCKNSFENDDKNFSSETSANMLISHGRYFVDNYLIPLIRATTDLGTIIVIAIGLFIQFPIPLVFFIGAAFISLSSYQLLSKGFLRDNGEIVLKCYEDIIRSSKDGFSSSFISTLGSNKDISIKNVLDRKRRSSLILGSISQGLKYVVEFCFMFSFATSAMAMLFFNPDLIAAFVGTFAYAGVRMLPSFTSIIAFFQSRSAAEHAVYELLKLLHPKSIGKVI